MSGDYQLVTLANGARTLFSASFGEKMHPGLGPQAEAERLYVRQLNLRKRLQNHSGEFVIWDIGLGAAANAIASLRETRDIPGRLRLLSFDYTCEPLEFALKHSAALGYAAGYEKEIIELLRSRRVEFQSGKLSVTWEFHLGDFPTLLDSELVGRASPRVAHNVPNPAREILADGLRPRPTAKLFAPDAIFYDPFSPAKNPAMWTLPLSENLFRALDPARPCTLTTYSRSTLVRVMLLLAGFFVGLGPATGRKEETTIAANNLDLLAEPLNARWLDRARRSHSAEPMRAPVYRSAPLGAEDWQQLQAHPQFEPGMRRAKKTYKSG